MYGTCWALFQRPARQTPSVVLTARMGGVFFLFGISHRRAPVGMGRLHRCVSKRSRLDSPPIEAAPLIPFKFGAGEKKKVRWQNIGNSACAKYV